MSRTHPIEELGGYVLDALEPEERAAVAAHLAECPVCRVEHDRLAGLPDLLRPAEGLEILPAPLALEEHVLDRIAQERGAKPHRGGLLARLRLVTRGRRRLHRGRAAMAAGLAGAVLGAAATALVLSGGGEEAGAPGGHYAVALSGATGATARAELQPGRGGTEVHLWVKGLPPGTEAVYEVRCEGSGWSASAGTFRADARGRAYVVLTTAARIGEYERIRVVRPSDPDGDVMSGEIQ